MKFLITFGVFLTVSFLAVAQEDFESDDVPFDADANEIRKSVSRRNRCGTRTWQPKSIAKEEIVRKLILRSFAENLLINKIKKKTI